MTHDVPKGKKELKKKYIPKVKPQEAKKYEVVVVKESSVILDVDGNGYQQPKVNKDVAIGDYVKLKI